ncbi:COPII-coated vesicle component Erv41 [Schizosaccharomyces japonicus yFS275]|uniref:Endoplasmic reticulum-Golgi intermediate compartment protein n=1 Tax=Schizosaccharomyces japonicus (strain yFS275 / FY16936) TaxID=402676 RepID=B6K5F8_SCHJY|nr:COPII-coated vesicle component Erv41 [Schizosaccharomyces japonicus yFS275]EEB08762.1 COPII-coated vesicle component Erv41 [Schizosaccharomyces japonicus yFS275]
MFTDKIPEGIRVFDAFPKVAKTYRKQRSSQGGLLSIILAICITCISIMEFFFYFQGTREQQFFVYETISEHMNINLDMTIAMPCKFLQVDVLDQTMDHVFATEVFTKQETTVEDMRHEPLPVTSTGSFDAADLRRTRRKKFNKKSKTLPDGGSACRFYGAVTVHRTQGLLHITAPGWGYGMSNIPLNALNFTHAIDELSFGDYYPSLVNALDGSYGFTDEHAFAFQYYTSIIPTTYTSTFRNVQTNQYAVTENSVRRQTGFRSDPPGIFISYDIEPLGIHIRETYPSLGNTILRILAISGGLVTVTTWVERFYAKRNHTPSPGLLDKDEDD